MEVERYDDVRAFYTRVAPFLERNEAAHTLQLGFRDRLERNPHAFGDADPILLAVTASGTVIGVATQTPPFPAALSLFEDPAGAEAVAEHLAAHNCDLPGLAAPVGVDERFLERWRALTGAEAAIDRRERIYAAHTVIAPRPTSGRLRPFAAHDRELVVAWIAAFAAEVMPGSALDDPERFLERRAEDPAAGLVLWDDGGPVSLAGFGAPSPNGMRIGPVYTPPELRGRGYASAVTAAATAQVLEGGRRFCFLYTDLANPTSNSIYQRIGYEPVIDVNAWTFARR